MNNLKFDFLINKTWNNKDIDHKPTQISLERSENGDFLIIKINAIFFNSPFKPDKTPGDFFNLWDYEVVEAFFLNDSNQHYIELEFGP
jgi:hypothetical protein